MKKRTQTEANFRLLFYRFSAMLLWLFLKFFTHYQVHCQGNAPVKKPLIIAANHSSFLDPPIVGVTLTIFFRTYPVYFMTKASLMKKPLLGLLLRALGCFPAGVSLKKPMEILFEGEMLGVFPQGTRRKKFALDQGKAGTAALALWAKTQILPVAIFDSAPGSIMKFLLRQRRIRVRVGQPFSLEERLGCKKSYSRDDFREGTKIIMAEIKKLLEQET